MSEGFTGKTRVTKLKFNPGKPVTVGYEISTPSGKWESYSMSCEEQPLPAMADAMAGLARCVADICEIDHDPDEHPITVIGVTWTYNAENVMGAVITGLRALSGGGTPMVINTPHMSSASESDTAKDRLSMGDLGRSHFRVFTPWVRTTPLCIFCTAVFLGYELMVKRERRCTPYFVEIYAVPYDAPATRVYRSRKQFEKLDDAKAWAMNKLKEITK